MMTDCAGIPALIKSDQVGVVAVILAWLVLTGNVLFCSVKVRLLNDGVKKDKTPYVATLTELETQLQDLQNRLKAIEDRMGPYEEEFA
jgi:hypothetical protein